VVSPFPMRTSRGALKLLPVHDGRADAVLAEQPGPRLDPEGPHRPGPEPAAAVQQHDEREGARAFRFVNRYRQRAGSRTRALFLDRAFLEAAGVAGTPGNLDGLTSRRVRSDCRPREKADQPRKHTEAHGQDQRRDRC